MPGKRILVVEDEVIISSDIQNTLRALGYEVAGSARSGQDAIARVAALEPDLVLMDIVLEGPMTGTEAAEVITGKYDIPVVYLTAFADEETLAKAKITDAFGYVLKPFEDRGLQIALQMALYKSDMTRRLRESERRFRVLYEEAPLAYQSLDSDGLICDVNQAWLDLTGYTRDQVIGRPFASLLAPADGSDFDARFERFKAAGQIRGQLLEIVRAGGDHLTVSWDGQLASGGGDTTRAHCILTDVTERVRAGKALRESEEHFRRVVESSAAGYSLVDRDGRYLEVNQAWLQMYGFESADQVIGRPFTDLQPADNVPNARKAMEVLLAGEVIRSAEGRFMRADGAVGHQIMTARPVLRDGVITGSEAFHIDITERRQAEEALRESQEHYRRLVELSPEAIFVHCDGKFVYANPAAVRLFGAEEPDDLLGRDQMELVHPDMRASVQQRRQRILEQGIAMPRIEQRYLRLDGSVAYAESGSAPFVYEGRKAVQVVARDVSERVAARRALEESEDRYRRLVELSPDAMYIQVDGRIAFINQAGVRLFGADRAEQLVGTSVLDHVHPDYREGIAERMRAVNSQRYEAPPQHQVFLRLDGTMVDVEAAATPFVYLGRNGGQVIARDISERRQREREMEAVVTVSAALRTAVTRAEMYPLIGEQVSRLMHGDGVALVQRDAVTGELVFEMGLGAWAGAVGQRLTPDRGLSAQVIDQRSPYLNQDVRREGNVQRPDLLTDVVSVCCVPLIVQGEATGAFWLGRSKGNPMGTVITEGEVRVLSAIADMAANALHRSALHEATERRLRQINALHTIDAAISASLDLRVTLDVLLDQVTTHLSVTAAAVLLYNSHTQQLSHAAGRGFRSPGLSKIRLRLGEGSAGRAVVERQAVTCSDLKSVEGDPRSRLLVADGLVCSYSTPLLAKGMIKGVLEVYDSRPIAPDQEWLDFLTTLAGQAAIAIDNAELFDRLQISSAELAIAYDSTLEGWSRALDLRDKETEGHTVRTAEMTVRLAQAVGLSPNDLVHVRRGALLHDIGKMGVPDGILLKPGPLTEDEWTVMRRHPVYAYEMLAPIVYLRPALDIPYGHHEKWDGSGYPRGLKGEQIPLAARIFAVIDVWDALISDRPYRPAWSEEKARGHIRDQAGKHFDPRVVEAFLASVGGEG